MACGFHRVIFRECLETRDLLCVMGRGLGMNTLLSLFVRLYSTSHGSGGLVLFLNVDKEVAAEFVECAMREGAEFPPQIVDGQNQQERARMYGRGGVVFVNTQILVVDLLRSLVPYSTCVGVLVSDAHFIEEHGTLWFALRLLRLFGSDKLFIKGFTSRVDQLQHGAKCESAMRGLLASKLFLWPRFEARVSDELNANQPEVVEIFVPLSGRQSAIYSSLQILTQAIVQELCKGKISLDIPEPTQENAFVENWYALVNSQLSPFWHQLGPKTKQLVGDLGIMRKLCTALLHYDCVLYNRFLETIRLEKLDNPSDWMFHEAGDKLFANARARVFLQQEADKTVFILDPQPKWDALREVLAEIRAEPVKSNVLVVVKDERSARQVSGVLAKGDDAWLMDQWSFSVDRGMYRARGAGPRRAASAASVAQPVPVATASTAKGGKKKRVKRAASTPQVSKSIAELFKSAKQVGSLAAFPPAPSSEAASRRNEFERMFGLLENSVVIHPLDSTTDAASMLHRLRPLYVVMYDTNLSFLRSLECYKSTPQGSSHPMRTYLMSYDVDSEDSRDLESENEAFERLINIKASMIIEEERGLVVRGSPFAEEGASSSAEPASSRVGGSGGIGLIHQPAYVVVDTREFMGSKIPAKLWMRGFEVVPMMTEIGDYVVANDIVIERKTVPDLIGSFADGRLFKQCTNMQAHYAVSILLIEFQGGPFQLQARHELLPQVTHTSLSSKLTLLVLHFPKLRIFWSKDTAQSVAFITSLRKNSPVGGPDVERIAKSAVTNVRQLDDAIVDVTPRLFLSKLPGVFAATADVLAQRGKNLRTLITTFDAREYAGVMGKENAAALETFLQRTYAKDDE